MTTVVCYHILVMILILLCHNYSNIITIVMTKSRLKGTAYPSGAPEFSPGF